MPVVAFGGSQTRIAITIAALTSCDLHINHDLVVGKMCLTTFMPTLQHDFGSGGVWWALGSAFTNRPGVVAEPPVGGPQKNHRAKTKRREETACDQDPLANAIK